MRKSILVGAALLSLWSAPRTPAIVLFSDSFTYTNGSLVSASGGIWVHHSGTTTGEVKIISGKVFLSETNAEDVSALLQGQPYPPTTNVSLYASFTINFTSLPSGGGAYFAHLKAGGTTGFGDKIYATTNGAPAGFFRLGVANSDNAVPSIVINSNLSLNTDYFIVTRYVVSNAISTVWLNPTAEGDPSITASDPVSFTNSVTSFALRESLSSGSGMGSLYLDDLILGTRFSDVVLNLSGPPAITSQPQSQTVNEGSNVTFTVEAGGEPPLYYQWSFNGTNLDGATNSLLTLLGVTTNQAGNYQVMITNSIGATNSDPAALTVNPLYSPPAIIAQPQSQTVAAGADVTLMVNASGTLPLAYQWQFNGTPLSAATNSSLVLNDITTNQAGNYTVTITNVLGSTNSQPATVMVYIPLPQSPAFSYLTYNLKGNGASNWSTNSLQVQAIGRQIMYLSPDIMTFNEIPNQFTYEMTNFITAFLPGYYLVTNSATDGFIRSVIASRFPILASKSYLHSSDLNPYGYTNSNFTRDLFEAAIAVPGFPLPLHVFAVHLKSGQNTDDSTKRAAEASAISNFFVNAFLTTNSAHPYVLSGDTNEDVDDPPVSNLGAIQRLANAATGLQLTTPLNPITSTGLTFSIQSSNGLTKRYDYIMPNALLFSNIAGSQVFRTDLLTNPPPPLLTNDDKTASDHLPVLMVFSNPYARPFRLTSITRTNQALTLKWESVLGQPYRVEASSNLSDWTILAGNLVATGANSTFSTNLTAAHDFFRISRVP